MVEHTREAADGTVEVLRAARAGEHVMQRAEDARRGEVVFPRGHRIRPADVGALSGIGCAQVAVYRRPRVAVIATGDEIVPPDVVPGAGQVRNVNQYALRALIAAAGGDTLDLGVLPDRRERIGRALGRALDEADLALTSGGSSVGTLDLIPAVVASMPRAEILVHGIRVKPGKPTLIARVGRKPVVGLPGNPTSALVIFHAFALPLIRSIGGEPAHVAFAPRLRATARLGTDIGSQAGREDWVRVALEEGADGDPVARPVPGGSGDIVSFVRADGLVRVDAETEAVPAGTVVRVELLG
jgi:molybdopterin molybdotransferase